MSDFPGVAPNIHRCIIKPFLMTHSKTRFDVKQFLTFKIFNTQTNIIYNTCHRKNSNIVTCTVAEKSLTSIKLLNVY